MNILKRIFKPKIKYISGVLEDVRPPEEKKKDFLTEEILVSALPLNWITWENWKADPINIKMLNDIEVNNQRSVGSCASHSSSLSLAINNYLEDKKFIKFSAKPIYARRRNKPSVGMYMDDVGQICIKNGTVPEINYPSSNDSDENMSNLDGFISLYEAIGKVLKAQSYFWLDNNIDSYAQVLAMNKPIVMTVVFGDGEFGELAPVVKPVVPKYGHAICVLPNAYFTYQGKKAILIQNSWGTGIGYGGRQILTEDWFTHNRVVCAIWFEDIHNLEVFNQQVISELKPKYQFNKDLYLGMNNSDVAMLQVCLATIQDSDGFLFPLWQGQSPTGYFGGLTLKAVKRFQEKYKDEILTPLGLTSATGYVRSFTRKKLNELFT